MATSSDLKVDEPDEDESSYESSSSSEQELVPLERPVFLKRHVHPCKEDTRETKKRQVLLQRVEYENQAIKARQDAQKLLGMNYSSDQDVLRSALMLDDNDLTNSELERQLWLQRQEARRKARRDRLVAKQLELEAYEANRLKSDAMKLDKQESCNVNQKVPKPSFDRKPRYKPEKARDTKFGTSKSQKEDTEYSILVRILQAALREECSEKKDKIMSLVPLKPDLPQFLAPYLPQHEGQLPFITLTYAQSLDSRISKGRGIRTIISHPETKTMTHYLRYHHDGILVGAGTALADDPGLNCKYGGAFEKSPRPIVLNFSQRWKFEGSKLQELSIKKEGKSPIIVVSQEPDRKEPGVSYMVCPSVDWQVLFSRLRSEYGLKSVMVEGGANVINQLLMRQELVSSLIITVGPVYLGEKGVQVSPPSACELHQVKWWRGTTDVVMCARLQNGDP